MAPKSVEHVFASHGVAFAYLFGSQAVGRSHPLSDRDIAVHFRDEIPNKRRLNLRLRLWNKLSDLWPEQPIDLIDLGESPLLLRFRVIQQGQSLFSTDEMKRIHFEAQTMSLYFDRQYYIERGAHQAIGRASRQGLA